MRVLEGLPGRVLLARALRQACCRPNALYLSPVGGYLLRAGPSILSLGATLNARANM